MTLTPAHVLILAGSRGGTDPVAQAAGVDRKTFAPIAGIPMIQRVVQAVRDALPGTPLTLAMDPPEAEQSQAVLSMLRQGGPLDIQPPAASPARTVSAALEAMGRAGPLLVATGDHALLTPAMVRHFLDHVPAGTNGAVAVATRDTIAAAYPETRRTYWRFADRHVSGCNLFLLDGDGAARLVSFWTCLEQERKRPWAMIRRLGPITLIQFVLGWLRLDRALDRLGRRIGAKLAAVDMPFAEAAMDVDKPSDLILAEQILSHRKS